MLADPKQAAAFDLTSANGAEQIVRRSQLFQDLISSVETFCQSQGFTDQDAILLTLWRLWLPLSLQLIEHRQRSDRPLVQGILGGQGTGKTTLTQVCGLILQQLGYRSMSLSIDDLYKTYRERQTLLQSDPRLIWRGPPGTHDVDLGIATLDRARQSERTDPIPVPRFDKSLHHGMGDRIEPELVSPADIIFFEGWFTGTRPVDPRLFDQRIDPIITDSDREFARASNQRLHDYFPLWQRLDRLMILYPVDYRLSKQWRKEAEHKMKAQGKSGMDDAEIEQFVEYFWKALHPELFITPLTRLPQFTDLVVEIQPDHRVGKIYRPL
jgi:D-glycerate 3-kinase